MRIQSSLAITISLWISLAFGPSANADSAIFQQKCAACHTVGQGNRIGPDLLDVSRKRESAWLIRWIMEPDKMVAEKDPIALDLLKQFNQIPMPNLGVSETEALSLIAYINSESEAAAGKVQSNQAEKAAGSALSAWFESPQFLAFLIFLVLALVIAFVFWRVVASTADPVPSIDVKSAYALRRKLFVGASIVVLGTLAATLPFTPYPKDDAVPDQLVYVAAKQFQFIYSSEPILSEEDIARVPAIDPLTIAAGALVEFRVTSLDATHGFAIYGPDDAVFAQTQAMPGYTNRLRVRFPAPGNYNVLCLEYCGLAHHLMRATFEVK